ncbi:phosphodiesterase [Pseudonocardiaceae bacterium YIM PH 21723]|nr:phosphodiesterase [Pseudonocardiaceae bacterium YIM PH 21723]
MTLLAHLSDSHVGATDHSAQRLRAVLAALPAGVDAILLTGDVSDHGAPGEYRAVRSLLPASALVCPGNHDLRAEFREHLLGLPPGDAPINSAHRLPGLLVLMCDSLVPGEDYGLLAEETLTWMDAELSAEPELPAVLAFHHPPIQIGIELPDSIRLRETEGLTALLDRHPQVRALLCGHVHSPVAGDFAGRPVRIAPGIISTMQLPGEAGKGKFDLTMGPGFALHVLEDGGITTHFRVLPVEGVVL